MSTYSSATVGFFLVGGRDVLGTRTAIEVAAEASVKETTVIGVAWPTFAATGIKRGQATQEGWFDDAVGSVNEALCEREGTSQVLLLAHLGNTRGLQTWGFAGSYAGSYARGLAVDEFHKATATHTLSGAVEQPLLLDTLRAHTTAGDTQTTPVDNTSSSNTGGAGYLACSALTLGGYTNLVVKVRHSSDNITYADLATFTAVTLGPTAERVAVASGTTINRYLAISWTWTGSGSGQSATFAVAFARL